MNKTLSAGFVLILGASLSACVVSRSEPLPEPTLTYTKPASPSPLTSLEREKQRLHGYMQQAWDEQSEISKERICAYFNVAPYSAFQQLVRSGNTLGITFDTYKEFFDKVCYKY